MIKLHESETTFDEIIEYIEKGEEVGVYVDDSTELFTMRLLAWVSRVSTEKLKNAKLISTYEWIALQCAAGSLAKLNIYVEKAPEASLESH